MQVVKYARQSESCVIQLQHAVLVELINVVVNLPLLYIAAVSKCHGLANSNCLKR